jgi:signal transduction histidine kinase
LRWRIRYQLLLPLLLLLLGVVGLSVWMAIAAAERARGDIEGRVRGVASVLSEKEIPLRPNILLMVKGLSGADYLLVRRDGERLSTLEEVPTQTPEAAVCEQWQALRLGPPVRVGQRTYLCGAIRLQRSPNTGDTLYILYPESLWKDARWQAVWPFLVLAGSAGLASVVLAVGLGWRVGGRIQDLERRTRLIAGGDFSPMPLPRSDDEIRDLARSVNEMAQRLAQFQETAQRTERLRLLGQVGGGLAHQLRNGLTGARLAVQLFIRESAGSTDTAALEVALRQLTLLEAHLKRFLDLGKQDSGQRQPCSLTSLTAEAVDLLRPQCRHAGIDLRWQRPAEEAVVLGDSGQLAQLVLNVLGNAVEAAGPGGWVEVRLGRGEGLQGRVWLVIEDSGPGPPPQVAGRLFEPFVTGKPEGVGLGLAVARQVAEAHGGTLAWDRAAAHTTFRIELPAALQHVTPKAQSPWVNQRQGGGQGG